MSFPYEKTVEVTVQAGQSNHVAVPFIHRGVLTRLVAKQLDGSLDGFICDLYNSKQPMQDHSQSSLSEAAPAIDAVAYKILPTQQALAGDALVEMHEPAGYPFRNVDGSYSVPQRFVYLDINAHGTGEKQFQVTLVGVPPV